MNGNIGNTSLFFEETGRGNIVVFLHGFPFDHSMWQDAPRYLSNNYRLIAPDLRGFGKTTLPVSMVTSMTQFASDVADLTELVSKSCPQIDQESKFVICGLSMGGYVAMHFAKNFGDRLAGLVLCDTKAQADSEAAAQNRKKRADALTETSLDALVDAMIPNLLAPQTSEDVRRNVRQMMMRQGLDGVAAADRGMAERPDTTEWLREIICPTLVICGEHDAITSVDEMKCMSEQLPNAKFHVIPKAGHLTPIESPQIFYETLKTFLDDLSPEIVK